jgi:hypothetical protein
MERRREGGRVSASQRKCPAHISNHDDTTSATTGVKQKGTKRKDTNLDPFLGLALEQPVEAPLGVVRGRAAEVELGREPPILRGEVSIRVLIRS